MTDFQIVLVGLAVFFIVWGATFVMFARPLAGWLRRRGRRYSAPPVFISSPTYLRVVGTFSLLFALAALVVGMKVS